MILHILVGDLALDKLPKKVKWIKLQVFADDINEYGIHSDQFFGENIVRFNQTIHCPVNELESVITKASFVVQAILFDGTYLPIGSSSLLCSSMEQPTTKSVVIHDKLEAYVGRLTVTVFHNLTPIELNEGEILTKQNNYSPNLKEYAFLLSRRANRKPGSEYDHPITFNHRLEASVNESVNDTFKIQQFLAGNNGTKVKTKTALNTGARKAKTTAPNTLTKRVVQKSTDPRAHVYTSHIYQNQNQFIRPPINQLNAIYNTPHSVYGATACSTKTRISSPYEKPLKRPVTTSTRRPLSGRTEPQLRSTQMRVGYAHTQWPDAKAAEVQHEKKMYSLFLAEERRLALLREVNEEVKYKNKQTKLRIAENKARRAKTARDDSQLKDVLDHKEREISVLRAQLQYMKTHKQHLERKAEDGGSSELTTTHNSRGRMKSTAVSVGNSKPLTRRSSSAPVRRSSNTANENADRQFSGFIPPRSPHSQLNYENTMALRAENKHQNSYHPVHITVPGGNYTPIHRAPSPYEVKLQSVSTTESKKSRTSSAAGSLHSGSERRRHKSHSDAAATGTSSNSSSKVLRAANELHRKSTDNTYHRYNAKQQKLSRHEAKLASANYPPNSASRSHNSSSSRHRSMSGSVGTVISTNTTNNKSTYGSGNRSDNNTNHYNRHNNIDNNNNNKNINNNTTNRNGNVESIATDWLASARASVNQLHSRNNNDSKSYRSNRYSNSSNSEKHTYGIINEMNNSYPHRHFEPEQQQRTNSSRNNGKNNSSKRNKTKHNIASSDDNSVISRDLSLDASDNISVSNSSSSDSGSLNNAGASFSDSSDESEIEVIYKETLRNYNNKKNQNQNNDQNIQKESKKNNISQSDNKPLAAANDRQMHANYNGDCRGNLDSSDHSDHDNTNDDFKVPGFLNSFVNQHNRHPQHSYSNNGGHLDDSLVSTATADLLIPAVQNRHSTTRNNSDNNRNKGNNNYNNISNNNNNVSRLSTESILRSAEKQQQQQQLQQLQQQAGEVNQSAAHTAHTAQHISDKARYQLDQLRHTSMAGTSNTTSSGNNNSSGNNSFGMNTNGNNNISNKNNNNNNNNISNSSTSSSSSVDKQYKYNFTIPTAAKLTNSNALDSDIYDAQHAVAKIHSTVETQFEKNKQFSDLSVEKQSRKNTGNNIISRVHSINSANDNNLKNNNNSNNSNNNNSNNGNNSNNNNVYRKSPTEFTDTLKYNYNIVPATHNNNEQHSANTTNRSVPHASVDGSEHPLPMMLLPHEEKEKIIQHQFEKNRLYVANNSNSSNNTANSNNNNSVTSSATKTAAEIRAQHQAAQSPDRNIIPNNASNNVNSKTNNTHNTVSPSRRAVSHLPSPEAMNRTLNDVSDAISTLEARLNKFSSLGPSHTADNAANDHNLLKSTTVVIAAKSRSVLHHNDRSSSSSDSGDSDNSVVKFGQSLKKLGSNNNTTGSSNEYKSYFKEVVTTSNHDTVAREIAKSVRNYKDSVSRGDGTRSPMEQDSLEMSFRK